MRISRDIMSAWKRIKRYFGAWQRSNDDDEKEKLLLKVRKWIEMLKGIFYSKGYFQEACKIFKIGISVEECVELLEIKFSRYGIVDVSSLVQYTDKDTSLLAEIHSEKTVRFATTD